MATSKKTAGKKTSAKSTPRKAAGTEPAPLVLKKETIEDLQALLKQTSKLRQSRKVCIA